MRFADLQASYTVSQCDCTAGIKPSKYSLIDRKSIGSV
ncbi:hypothetical protein BOH78_1916 [Pichia kudriavzevii]|uniref:Uncharacterized protein n=1 Tax=Pichia kudriavzevii TaxID=4909 RepID=A0A1V2LPE6_PICKU|nr:hypothetical protein BOH78_1916 [Pichia kudriavzevii]